MIHCAKSTKNITDDGQTCMTIGKFNIRRLNVGKSRAAKADLIEADDDVLNIAEGVANVIVKEYGSWRRGCGSAMFRFMVDDDDNAYVECLEDGSGTMGMYITLLGTIDVSEVLEMVNGPDKDDGHGGSTLMHAILNECNVDKRKLMEYIWWNTREAKRKMRHMTPRQRPDEFEEGLGIPDWILAIVNEKLDNLIDVNTRTVLTITNDMVVRGLNALFRGKGLNKVSRRFTITKA